MKPVEIEIPGLRKAVLKGNHPDIKDLSILTDNHACLICWEISEEELKVLNETKRMYQIVYHEPTNFPPVSLEVHEPQVYEKTEEKTKEQE